jgi:hypothetical protein
LSMFYRKIKMLFFRGFLCAKRRSGRQVDDTRRILARPLQM